MILELQCHENSKKKGETNNGFVHSGYENDHNNFHNHHHHRIMSLQTMDVCALRMHLRYLLIPPAGFPGGPAVISFHGLRSERLAAYLSPDQQLIPTSQRHLRAL